jgi:hypothetical protein
MPSLDAALFTGVKLLFPVFSAHHQESNRAEDHFALQRFKKKFTDTIFLTSLMSCHRSRRAGAA